MAEWLKTLTGTLCVLTVLMHLIPRGKFEKYVRFYAGLLFFLVAAGPVWKLMAGDGMLEHLLELEFLREEHYDLESAVEGMAELKNERIQSAYRDEIARQIAETAQAYGVSASGIRLSFDGEDGYLLTGMSFRADTGAEDRAAALDGLRRELAGVYMLDLNRIQIRRQGE